MSIELQKPGDFGELANTDHSSIIFLEGLMPLMLVRISSLVLF
jgi:hypothetical protein